MHLRLQREKQTAYNLHLISLDFHDGKGPDESSLKWEKGDVPLKPLPISI